MTSESQQDPGPAGDRWRGDVEDGVAAWTHGHAAPEQQATHRTRAGRGRAPGPRGGRHVSAPDASDGPGDGPDADPESVARTILLDQLTGRARSRHELRDKLASRRVPGEIAEQLLDRFEQVGLVDDAAFARAWVAGRQSAKGLARRAIADELRRKGVDDEVARAALDEIDPDDEDAAARDLVRRKMRTLRHVDRTTAIRRLVAMLGRKGYPPGTAYAVVRDELAAGDLEEDDEAAFVDGP